MKNLMFLFVVTIASLCFITQAKAQESSFLDPVSVPESVQKDVANFERSLIQAEINYNRQTVIATKKLLLDLNRQITTAEKEKSKDLDSLKTLKEKADKHLEQLENRIKELTEQPKKTEKNVAPGGVVTGLGTFKKNDIVEISATGQWFQGGLWKDGKPVFSGPDGVDDQKDAVFPEGTLVVVVMDKLKETSSSNRINSRVPRNNVGSGGLYVVRHYDDEPSLYAYGHRRYISSAASGSVKVQITAKKDHVGVWDEFKIKPVIKSPFKS